MGRSHYLPADRVARAGSSGEVLLRYGIPRGEEGRARRCTAHDWDGCRASRGCLYDAGSDGPRGSSPSGHARRVKVAAAACRVLPGSHSRRISIQGGREKACSRFECRNADYADGPLALGQVPSSRTRLMSRRKARHSTVPAVKPAKSRPVSTPLPGRRKTPRPPARALPSGPAPRHELASIMPPAESSLADVIDNLLNRGVVLNADLILALADVDLIYVRLSALLCAADRILTRP